MRIPFLTMLVFCACTSHAQETYRCKTPSGTVYQDRPCAGSGRYSDNLPVARPSPADPGASQASNSSKLDQDKAYIADRVKTRIFEREKDEAAAAIQGCENEVSGLQNSISQIANSYQTGVPLNQASAAALQLDMQRRQAEISALQSRSTAKQRECDLMRVEYDRKFRKL